MIVGGHAKRTARLKSNPMVAICKNCNHQISQGEERQWVISPIPGFIHTNPNDCK